MKSACKTLLPALAILLLALASASVGRAQGERRRVSSPIAFYDDAEPVSPGVLSVSEYFSYGRVLAGRDISAPASYFNLGLHKRFDVSGGVALARSQFEESRINGPGDAYLGSKILILAESGRRPGLAFKPMLEVLGRASIADNPLAPDRINFVLPVAAQKSFDYYRVYYMAGYVSRGIVFHSLAFEWNRWSRFTPMAIISSSRLTHELRLISELGLNRSRSDLVGGVVVAIRPNWSVFANTGRSFGRLDLNSTRYQVTAGTSFHLRLWGR